MPKTLTQSQKNSMTYFWILLVLILLASLFLYKKSGKFTKTDYTTPDSTMIKNTDDLDTTGKELDQTNVDAQIDSGLNLLQEDAAALP